MLNHEFMRPIAHRGLHDARRGIIENSRPAFEAAIARGYGIECDLRHARDGTAFVFHDATFERLLGRKTRVAALDAGQIGKLAYADGSPIITFDELLGLIGDSIPLLAEIKSEWRALPEAFLDNVAASASRHRGHVALMSFDPVAMAEMRKRAPRVPRGIVAGIYDPKEGDGWWSDKLNPERQLRLSHLLESRDSAPDFYNYHVKALPTPVTRFVREVQGVPLFAWTVRTKEDRATARKWADQAVFEGFEP